VNKSKKVGCPDPYSAERYLHRHGHIHLVPQNLVVAFGRAYIGPRPAGSGKGGLREGGVHMNVIMLQRHEDPAHPDHDLRGRSVLDSRDHQLGYVANLFVDEDERHLRFIDVVPQDWLGRERKRHHHLVPMEALILPAEASRRDSYGSVELQVNKETVESSPTLPPSFDAPDAELQEAVRKHYEAALR
jgi:hypothetical protein